MTLPRSYFLAQVPKLLEARSLVSVFGGVQALVSFNLSMDPGEITALIGPHGSGKSTVIDALTGVRPPRSGMALVGRKPILDLPPAKIARLGLVRTFQTPRLFWDRTALDNVIVGLHRRAAPGLWGTLLRSPGSNRMHARARQAALDLLATMELADCADVAAGALDFAQRRRLEIARALASGPKILLLDEPAAGLEPSSRTALGELMLFLRERFQIGICFTDDTPDLAMEIADQVIVLDHGHTAAAGSSEELAGDPVIQSLFSRKMD